MLPREARPACFPGHDLGDPISISTGGPQPEAVAIADLDGDGHPDLIVANSADAGVFSDSGSVAVLRGQGDGTFDPPRLYVAGLKPVAVAIGDVNLDGHLDIVVANYQGASFTVLLGKGDGTFIRGGTFPSYCFDPRSIVVADFNGDGAPDVAVAGRTGLSVTVFLNSGSGQFASPSTIISLGAYVQSLHVADLNGDGKLDLVATLYNTGHVVTLLGDGLGGMTSGATLTTSNGPTGVVVTDQDGDGIPDLAVTCDSDASLWFFHGLGGGAFAGSPQTIAGAATALAVTDFEGDHRPDLVAVLTSNQAVQVLTGEAPGTTPPYVANPPVLAGGQPVAVAVGDVNQDGVLDVITAIRNSNSLSIMLGQCSAPPPPPAMPLVDLWSSSGRPLVATPGVQTDVVACSDSVGGAFIAWLDTRKADGYRVFATHIDADGGIVGGWTPGGDEVAGAFIPDVVRIVADGQGGAVLAWLDYRTGTQELYAQHLLAPTPVDPRWRPAGLIPCSDTTSTKSYFSLASSTGGAILAWQDSRPGQIYATRLQVDGAFAPGWDAAGRRIGPATTYGGPGYERYEFPTLEADGSGGALLSYDYNGEFCTSDYCLPFANDEVLHLGASGSVIGPVGFTREANLYPSAFANPDGYGGMLLAHFGEPFTLSDLNPDLSQKWAVQPIVDDVSSFRGAPDGTGGDLFSWEEFDPPGYADPHLWITRVDRHGSRPVGWSSSGTPLCTTNGWRTPAALFTDGASGAIEIWQDERDGTDQLCGLHIGGGGDIPSGTANGQLLCSGPGTRVGPIILPSFGPTALVIWQDTRADSGDIYAQRITWDAAVPAEYSLVTSEAAPDHATLRWYAAARTGVILQRDRGGAGWADLANLAPDGSGFLTYVDHDVTPGERVGYRLASATRAPIATSETWVTIPARWVLALAGAMPNPTRGALRVSLTLPDTHPATLELFDVTGRRVATRSVGTLGPGPQWVSFDRERLASGVYLLRLEHDHDVRIRRAVVLR
jgi:hypothetical protein